MKPSLHHLATALLFLINVTACREIIDAPADMGGGGDAGMDMAVDAGPCGHACTGALECIVSDGGAACGCLTDENCPTSGNSACNTDTHQCVQCIDDTDCHDAQNSRCDNATNRCAPCETSANCAHPTTGGGSVCSTSGANIGCVECTHAEQSACTEAGHFCETLTNVCSDRAPGGQGLCEECTSDDDCATGRVCVAMTFGASATVIGNFCLFARLTEGEGAPAGSCDTVRAYTRVQNTASLDNATAVDVCAPLAETTCPAVQDYRTGTCDVSGDDECGFEGVADGLCRTVDSSHFCTIPCAVDNDCKVGATCSDTGRCVW